MAADPLKALFYSFEPGRLRLPGGVAILFVNGRVCPGLEYLRECRITAQQYFRPYAKALQLAGVETITEIPEGKLFDAVLISGARQHTEGLSGLAAALRILRADGLLACAAANDAGGRRLEDDLGALGVKCNAESKYKSRIVVTGRPQDAETDKVKAAIAAGSYQPVVEDLYISRPGVFCWDRVDTGSALLAENLPVMAGRGADFGCGYGFLACHILRASQAVSELVCIDADARAVECCRRTLEKNGFGGVNTKYLWADITDPAEVLPRDLDWIVMNPPFHEGKKALPGIGAAFIGRAASSLRSGGELWMVANAALPYEKILAANFRQNVRLREENGYKLYQAVK